MNREAVALGVPVYTTFQGRMGGVDEKLLREGRLRRLERASDVEIRRRDRSAGLSCHDASGSSSRASSFLTEFTSMEASAACISADG